MFRRSWSVYDRIVASNLMRHREMEALLREEFSQQAKPFSLLDLGCGDASMVAWALAGTQIRDYTGVELVEATTRLADENLRSVVPHRSFIVGNLIDAVRPGDGGPYDLVLASYSLHHLSLVEKAAFFRDVRDRLAAGGKFILIDLLTRPDEGRQPFLARTHCYADQLTAYVTPAEREEVRAHVDANDWPEDEATLTRLGREAGFTNIQRVYWDPGQFFAFITFA